MQDPAWIIRKPSVGRYTADVLKLEDLPLVAVDSLAR
jgi:hypothetical protein